MLYVCMYVFFFLLIRVQTLLRFLLFLFLIAEFPEVLRNLMIAPNYMIMLDLKISFSYHTFNFTSLEMDKDWVVVVVVFFFWVGVGGYVICLEKQKQMY